MLDVVMDPGGKNFAVTYINNTIPIWMGYHPFVRFNVKDSSSLLVFKKASKLFLNKAERLIIERYITRKAAKGISPEKMNLMIGLTLGNAFDMKNSPVTITSSSWKRKVDYEALVKLWRKLGGLVADKHFCDCILMYCVINNYEPGPILKKGIYAYKLLKAKERIARCKNKPPKYDIAKINALHRKILCLSKQSTYAPH